MLNHACRPNAEWYHEVLGRDDDVGRISGSRLSTTTSNGRRVVPRDRRDALRPRRRPHRARRRGTTAMMIGENLIDGHVTMRSSQHHIKPAHDRRERARVPRAPRTRTHARTPLSPRTQSPHSLSAHARTPLSPRARENPTLPAHAITPLSPRARDHLTLSPRTPSHADPAGAVRWPRSARRGVGPHTSRHTHRGTHVARPIPPVVASSHPRSRLDGLSGVADAGVRVVDRA